MNANRIPIVNAGMTNMGSLDRLARLGIAALLVFIELTAGEPRGANVVMTLVAIPLIITALIGWDPIYAMLGKRTATLHAKSVDPRTYRNLNANTGLNVGLPDRVGRFIVTAGLLSVTLFGTGAAEWGVYAALLSIPIMMTALVGYDPIYHMLGIRTAFISQGPIQVSRAMMHQPIEVFPLFDDDAPSNSGKRAA